MINIIIIIAINILKFIFIEFGLYRDGIILDLDVQIIDSHNYFWCGHGEVVHAFAE